MDEEEFARITNRIDLYNTLKRKYNGSVKGILEALDEKIEST